MMHRIIRTRMAVSIIHNLVLILLEKHLKKNHYPGENPQTKISKLKKELTKAIIYIPNKLGKKLNLIISEMSHCLIFQKLLPKTLLHIVMLINPEMASIMMRVDGR